MGKSRNGGREGGIRFFPFVYTRKTRNLGHCSRIPKPHFKSICSSKLIAKYRRNVDQANYLQHTNDPFLMHPLFPFKPFPNFDSPYHNNEKYIYTEYNTKREKDVFFYVLSRLSLCISHHSFRVDKEWTSIHQNQACAPVILILFLLPFFFFAFNMFLCQFSASFFVPASSFLFSSRSTLSSPSLLLGLLHILPVHNLPTTARKFTNEFSSKRLP